MAWSKHLFSIPGAFAGALIFGMMIKKSWTVSRASPAPHIGLIQMDLFGTLSRFPVPWIIFMTSKPMTALSLSLLLATANIALLLLAASGLFTPLPLLLPMFLAFLAFCAAAASTVAASRYRKERLPETLLFLASVAVWGVLTVADLSLYHWADLSY
jgi:hypothetical protein